METKVKIDIIELMKKTESLLTGHFELSSGLHSNQYFQCAKLLQYPEYAQLAGQEIAKTIDFEVETVLGPALGGLIIGHEVARALNKKSIFTERKDGEMSLRRGFEINKGEKVLIVEDVITTAKSALEAAKVVESLGGEVVGFACIVDRSQGQTGLKIRSLAQMQPVTFKPVECELCQQGLKAEKPGSRTKN